jgi:single-strand DNA-binding protein
MDYNRAFLAGRLTRDPEIRHTSKGIALGELGLAINRTYKDDAGQRKEEVTYVDVTIWSKQTEIAAQYLKKGDPVFVEGWLHLDKWEDHGQTRNKLRIIGDRIHLLGGKPPTSPGTTSAGPSAPTAKRSLRDIERNFDIIE